jgi:ATP-dependent helicase HrpA
MMADDQALLDFFTARVPETVVNGQRFELWRESREEADRSLLCLTMADVLVGDHAIRPEDFPDTLTLHGTTVPARYKFDPSAEDDGVTLAIPLGLLPQLDPGDLDWTMPGWQAEKITYFLHDLPKSARRDVEGAGGSLNDTARLLAETLAPFSGPMMPALAKALSTLTGSRISPDLFHPENAPRHLRLRVEVLDEERRVVADGRDLAELQSRLGVRAREALKNAATASPGERSWERAGLTKWDFGDLPAFVVRRAFGGDLRAYPALVDTGAAVDLALLESSAAAEEASRKGVRRLFTLAARRELSSISPRLPRPLAPAGGASPTRAQADAFHKQLLARIVDAAFGLDDGSPLPRTKGAFEAQLSRGLPKLDACFRLWVEALHATSVELDKALAALKAASKQPSGRDAVLDLEAQVEALVPADLVTFIPLTRLQHYPRYLRAAQTRLTRAVIDPRKDADKLAPVATLWATFKAKEARARAEDAADLVEIRWLFEELRVAVFAPELKTPVPVSAKRLADAIAGLRAREAR